MSTQLVKIDFDEEQLKLIKSQIAPKATDDELKLFIYQAKRTGLDPLTRQIYCIHRWNGALKKEAMTVQTSIDGFRVIAERSGDYGGQSEPVFNESNGKLISCKISVYRFKNDVRYEAAVGVAYWNEYVQTGKDGNPFGLWGKMPHTMLSKVAEALALRKAYPQDLSGLYTSDEMAQADTQPPAVQAVEVVSSEIKPYTESEYSEIKTRLEKITNIKELVDLYNQHKPEIDNDVKLRKSMTERKQFILRTIEQEAKK